MTTREAFMKIKIQMVIDDQPQYTEIACFEKENLSVETLGLTLKEGKIITEGIQKALVSNQVTDYITKLQPCPCCGKLRHIHGYHQLIYRTLFGKMHLDSPRLSECSCKSQKKTTFSPLVKILSKHTSPEFSYMQSKWASLMSYGLTAKFLEEVLPLQANISSVFYKTQEVAERLEKELGKEQGMYIDGCQRDWENLPRPDEPLLVGIDGGYVHAREGGDRKAGWFEVIVGKSLQKNHATKRFGFVADYDEKPTRRVYEMLQSQGLQMNQAITFLTDGGDTVRELSYYLSPQAEHILDWFHITMRITMMKQMAKGVLANKDFEPPDTDKELERVKWCLWHGNTFKALKILDSLRFNLECFSEEQEKQEVKQYKLYQAVDEFHGYIDNNSSAIPNYGERYRYGEAISSSFVESTVNEVISRRMAKKQQMRWTKKGAHLLLQVRIKTLNNELRQLFCKWYPNMKQESDHMISLAAAA